MGVAMTPDTANDVPAIDGLTLVPLRQLVDERGAVLYMLRADAPDFESFGECYFSEINPGVMKGWKRHRLQTQNIAVPAGRVRFVLLDEREWSPTKGRIDVVELGRPDAYVRLRIPPMLWYGFTCIALKPSLVANCVDIPHDPAESDVLGLDAPAWSSALELLRHGRMRA
jgi:dTDP-4-dehydrorhamnose 3,5-epimerase